MTTEEHDWLEYLYKIYSGQSTTNKTVIDLGTGTQFNVAQYPGYANFTANNFVVEPIESVSGGWGGRPNTNGNSSVDTYATIYKSYSNGILNAYLNMKVYFSQPVNGANNVLQSNKNANVHAYLIL